MVLNRNPKNYFAEVEQIAFSPVHMVPGIEASPDKMLQVSSLQSLLLHPRPLLLDAYSNLTNVVKSGPQLFQAAMVFPACGCLLQPP